MAAQNEGLLCTLMAIGAACLCIDTLQNHMPLEQVNQVDMLISKGDHYHAAGLQSLRSQLANGSQNLETVHAHSAIVFGYASARRRIFRLLHRRQQGLGLPVAEPGADLPTKLEWMHLLRGVQTIGRALRASEAAAKTILAGDQAPSDPHIAAYIHQAVAAQDIAPFDEIKIHSAPAHVPRHPLTLWVSSTVKPALHGLHTDLDEFYKRFQAHSSSPDDPVTRFTSHQADTEFEILQSLAAVRSAVSMLEALNNSIFQSLTQPNTSSSSNTPSPASAHSSPISHTSSSSSSQPANANSGSHDWRKAYLNPTPTFGPTESLARGVLTWPNRVSDPFVTLLTLPLPHAAVPSSTTTTTTDANSPASASATAAPDLVSFTQEMQLIAWNIYAHWAALSVIIEDECWWWADLGIVDVRNLEGLLAPYHDHHQRQQQKEAGSGGGGYFSMGGSLQDDGSGNGREEWWPGMVERAVEALRAGRG